MLYIQQNKTNATFQVLVANDLANIKNSDFLPSNQTKIIVHDFPHTGLETWMTVSILSYVRDPINASYDVIQGGAF